LIRTNERAGWLPPSPNMRTFPIHDEEPALVPAEASALSAPPRAAGEISIDSQWASDERDAASIESLLTNGKQPEAQLKELKLQFHGQASEYFRIWFVNICLTLLTLGIYSAWAKVRSKRYLYSHTVLDGTPFQYLGRPLPILRGRLIAVALLLIYFVSDNLITSLLPLVLLGGLVLAPWVFVRSAAFNARYTAYRNMTFSFVGRYPEAAMALYFLGLVPILAIGTAFDWGGLKGLHDIAFAVFGFCFPWWLANLKTFVVDNTRFGGINGELRIRGGELWGIYFRGGLLVFPPTIVAIILFSMADRAVTSQTAMVIDLTSGFVALIAGYALSHGYIQGRSTNLVWQHMRLGTVRFKSDLHASDMAWLYFGNAIAIIGSATLLTPWAVIRTIRYRTENLQAFYDDDLSTFEGSEKSTVQATGAEIGQIFDLDISL
jgi:uncharacterized membrane protein YjgN (DUF898 family)